MRHALILFSFLAILLTLALASGDEPPPAPTLVTEQVTRGEGLYRANCAVCHGATALGFEEAKGAFPEEHQRCQKCHKVNNSPLWNLKNSVHNNMFALGTPPALRGEGTLHAYPDAAALFHYLRATMPRPQPGRLTDAEYLDLTAFLLELQGVSPQDALTTENAATFLLP